MADSDTELAFLDRPRREAPPVSEPVPLTFHPLTFSDPCDKIAKALVVAQGKMEALIKDAAADVRSDKGSYRYKYASLAATIAAVQPAYNAAGIAILQPPGTVRNNGKLAVVAETMLLHETGQWCRGAIELDLVKTDPQGVGSGITYGRRYYLQGLSGIAPEDDDGNGASGRASTPAPASSSPVVDNLDDDEARLRVSALLHEMPKPWTGARMQVELKACGGDRLRLIELMQADLEQQLRKPPPTPKAPLVPPKEQAQEADLFRGQPPEPGDLPMTTKTRAMLFARLAALGIGQLQTGLEGPTKKADEQRAKAERLDWAAKYRVRVTSFAQIAENVGLWLADRAAEEGPEGHRPPQEAGE